MTCYCFRPNQMKIKNAQEYVLDPSVKRRAIYSVILLGFLGVAILGYLWQTNSFVGRGYKMAELKKQQIVIEAQAKETEIVLSEIQSLKNLKSQAGNLGMVVIDTVSYLSLTDTGVIALLK